MRETASYETSCVKIGSVIFAVVDERNKKGKERKERKEKIQKVAKYFTYL